MSKWASIAALGGALGAAAAVGVIALIAKEAEQHELRAAMDIGSGSMKLVVAQCHKVTNKITRVLQSEYVELLLAHDLKQSADGTLSESMLLQAMAVLRHLIRICESHKVPSRNIRAIATQVSWPQCQEGEK